jgi:DNA-binding beta-propeller fold protein YncE
MRYFRCAVVLGLLVGFGAAVSACANPEQPAQAKGGGAGADVLANAGVMDRLIERSAPHVPATGTAPSFVVDPAWPKMLPNNWIIGDIGGLYVDSHDHIWVYHRPRALVASDAGALGEGGKDAKGAPISVLGHPRRFGQVSGCCIPAPSVLQFDKAGTLLQAWGGPGDPGFLEKRCRQADGCFWPSREHGIYVDHNDFVYVGGNGQAVNFHGQFPWAPNFGDDSQVLKFKADGTFVYQIGRPGAKGPNSNDTNGGINGTPQPYLPADMTVDPKTNLLYIADGYGNRRVLIVDAATGKYVGHFGAYGQNPLPSEEAVTADIEASGPWAADFRAGRTKPKFFRGPLHCVKLSNDGFLYACDRGNNRIQVFKTAEVGKPCDNPNGEAGKCGFVADIPVAPHTASGTSGTVNFSSDPQQTCLYVADLANDTIYEINRQNFHEMDRFGTGGRQVGQFHWPHVVSVDSDGNVYTGEVDTAGRVQKFLRYGATGCSGSGGEPVGKYR